MENFNKPNYIRIYSDLIQSKFPDKRKKCEKFLTKENLSDLDILKIENILFGRSQEKGNGKYRAYKKSTILKILDFQVKQELNNSQLAKHYGLSRNTVAKWRKLYIQ